MALPKFNDTPIYEMIVPSTQKKVKFRPFLVKEQKILLIAMESQDEGQILESILNTISSCVQGDFKVSDLSVFDIGLSRKLELNTGSTISYGWKI